MEDKFTKFGVFLVRMQPLHNAHLFLIKKALEECDKVIILIGDSKEEGTIRNPFPYMLREMTLRRALREEVSCSDLNRIEIHKLPDYSSEDDFNNVLIWGHYLYYNIVSKTQYKYFSLYYNDEPEIITSWFDNEVKDCINLRVSPRQDIFDGLSATKIRKALVDDNMDYFKNNCPPFVVDNFEHFKKLYLKVLENAN